MSAQGLEYGLSENKHGNITSSEYWYFMNCSGIK